MKKIIALGLISGMVMSPFSGLAFSDILESPYKDEIEFFEKEEIVVGKGEGKFYPEDKLTRAETAKICAEILPDIYSEETRLVFSDVLFDHWGVKEIGNASLVIDALTPEYTERFPEEHSQRLFCPEKTVTSEYLLGVCLESIGYNISDIDIFEKAEKHGLIKGISVKEGQEIKRDEAMKIFYNTVNSPIVLTSGLNYDASKGGFVSVYKVLDGSSEDTPFMSLWMYKNKKR